MPNLPETRQSLLIRLKNRSEDAWAEFLDIYEKSIVEFARSKGLQDADASDVAQEVLSAVDHRVARLEESPIQKFRGWLFRATRNIAVNKIQELAKFPRTGGEQVSELAEGFDSDTLEFQRHYRRQLIRWAASQVKPKVNESTWAAFWMTTMEGKTTDEVARLLGMSHGNVYAAKFRVINRIQKLIDRFDESNDSFRMIRETRPWEEQQ